MYIHTYCMLHQTTMAYVHVLGISIFPSTAARAHLSFWGDVARRLGPALPSKQHTWKQVQGQAPLDSLVDL